MAHYHNVYWCVCILVGSAGGLELNHMIQDVYWCVLVCIGVYTYMHSSTCSVLPLDVVALCLCLSPVPSWLCADTDSVYSLSGIRPITLCCETFEGRTMMLLEWSMAAKE